MVVMTGNDVFALPLGLMGMHKSAWSLCCPLCAELCDARCHKAKETVRTLAGPLCCISPWSIFFMNTSKLSYVKVVDIMDLYIWFFMHFIGQLLVESLTGNEGKDRRETTQTGDVAVHDQCLKAGTQITIAELIMTMIWAWQACKKRSAGFVSWRMNSYNFASDPVAASAF